MNRLNEFSSLIKDIYQTASHCNVDEIADASILKLQKVIDFESAWYGWIEYLPESTTVHSTNVVNLPENFTKTWLGISDKDVISKQFRNDPFSVLDYHCLQKNQTEEMISFVNSYGIKSIATAMNFRGDRSTNFFVSIYRGDKHTFWSEDEKNLLQCAVDHIVEAMRNSLHYQMLQGGNAEVGLYTNKNGVMMLGKALLENTFNIKGFPEKVSLIKRSSVIDFSDKKFIINHDKNKSGKEANAYSVTIRELSKLDMLSVREKEVAQHLCSEGNYKIIAELLHISPATVRNHTQKIYTKLGINNRNQLISLVRKK